MRGDERIGQRSFSHAVVHLCAAPLTARAVVFPYLAPPGARLGDGLGHAIRSILPLQRDQPGREERDEGRKEEEEEVNGGRGGGQPPCGLWCTWIGG
jgi:hypothetical protein